MSRFARCMPVLYVEPWVGLRSLRRADSLFSTLLDDLRTATLEKNEDGVTVFHSPSYLPVSRSRLLKGITRRMWASAVRRAAHSMGIESPVVWISRPEMGFLLDNLGEQLSIYHVVDEYAGYTGLGSQQLERLRATEAYVLDQVDVSIVASPELLAAKSGAGRDIFVMENAVEPGEYESAVKSQSEPDDLKGIPKPRIGYSGLIGKRLNFKLLTCIGQCKRDWSIIMIGKIDRRECESDIDEFLALPNVYFLGEKRHSEVAGYIAGLDVGLMPYEINLETQHISPIKMYEYWAAGKPVISTAISAARRHDFAVEIVADCDDAVSIIDRILSLVNDERGKFLVDLARQNSWDARVQQVASELQARVAKKAGYVEGRTSA